MGDSEVKYKPNHTTVVILVISLMALLLLLFFLYKKLNKDTNGEYTIRRMVYKEGGIRDRVRGVVSAVETQLGVQLWPRSDTDEDGEEMQEVCDEESQLGECVRGSDSEGDDLENGEEEKENGRNRESESSDDNSSLACSEAGETAKLTDQPAAKAEEREEKMEDEKGGGEASGGAGLLIDLKQFSGSATWSEDGVCKEADVTAL